MRAKMCANRTQKRGLHRSSPFWAPVAMRHYVGPFGLAVGPGQGSELLGAIVTGAMRAHKSPIESEACRRWDRWGRTSAPRARPVSWLSDRRCNIRQGPKGVKLALCLSSTASHRPRKLTPFPRFRISPGIDSYLPRVLATLTDRAAHFHLLLARPSGWQGNDGQVMGSDGQ